MIDWNAIIVEAHGTAILKGWWDKPVTQASQLCNLHCELSEAFQEYRNGHEINEIYCKAAGCQNALTCKERCEDYHPMGVPVELADFCLRVCDWMGRYNLKYQEIYNAERMAGCVKWMVELDEFICFMHSYLFDGYFCTGTLSEVIGFVDEFCKNNNIPLEEALRQKMEYNRKRPYRHGGKRV